MIIWYVLVISQHEEEEGSTATSVLSTLETYGGLRANTLPINGRQDVLVDNLGNYNTSQGVIHRLFLQQNKKKLLSLCKYNNCETHISISLFLYAAWFMAYVVSGQCCRYYGSRQKLNWPFHRQKVTLSVYHGYNPKQDLIKRLFRPLLTVGLLSYRPFKSFQDYLYWKQTRLHSYIYLHTISSNILHVFADDGNVAVSCSFYKTIHMIMPARWAITGSFKNRSVWWHFSINSSNSLKLYEQGLWLFRPWPKTSVVLPNAWLHITTSIMFNELSGVNDASVIPSSTAD